MTTHADPAQGLRRGQVAAAAEVNTETLRYYERRGLLAEPDRSPGGHRLYPPEAVITLRVIKAAQQLGFTLDEVADLLELGRQARRRRAAAAGPGEAHRRRGTHRRPHEHPRQPERRPRRRLRRPGGVRGFRVLPHPVHRHHHPPGQSNRERRERLTMKLKDRHLAGGAGAACAVCCAASVVGLLGVAGFAATAATLTFAGVVFAIVIGAASIAAVLVRRSRLRQAASHRRTWKRSRSR